MSSELIKLPYPPSVNGIYGHTSRGPYLAHKVKAYRRDVLVSCLEQRVVPWRKTEPLGITINLHPPTKAKRDVDNPAKSVLDALEAAGVVDDDSQFHRMLIQKCEVVRGGFVTVEIYDLLNSGD